MKNLPIETALFVITGSALAGGATAVVVDVTDLGLEPLLLFPGGAFLGEIAALLLLGVYWRAYR